VAAGRPEDLTDGAGRLPVVLLPGLNTTPEVWSDVIARLPADRDYVRLECPALDTVEAVADAVAAAAPARFHLVGYSFGGYVALAILERHAERVESLAMVASSAIADTEGQRRYRDDCVAAAEAGRHEALNAASAPMSFNDEAAIPPALMDRYLAMMRAYGAERFAAHSRACARRPDRTQVLANTEVPVLFIGGEHDRVVSLRRQQESAAAAKADFRLLAGAGHQAPLEQPQALAEAFQDWWAQRR